MHIDKDNAGKISIIEMSEDNAKDLGVILLEFEQQLKKSDMPEQEKARLSSYSTSLRSKLVDTLNSL